MLYKVLGEFAEDEFETQLNKIGNLYDFLLTNNCLYLALKSYVNQQKGRKLIGSVFPKSKNYLIIEISEKNIPRENDFIREWCLDKFVKLDEQRYNDNEQDKLRKTMEAIDLFEKIIQQCPKEGSDSIGG